MKRFASTLRLLRRNWKAFLGFETLYKLSITALFIPLLVAVLSLTIRAAGLTYLSTESIKAYLLNPWTVISALILLLLAGFLTLFDMQAVIFCCHASHQNKKISLWSMARAGAASAKKVLHPKNWLSILFVLLVIPLTNAAAVSGLISQIELPEFIADYIRANAVLHLLQFCASVLLAVLALRWCFSLHVFTLEGKSFIASCRESCRLTKKRMVSIAVGTAVVGFLLQLLLILFGCLLAGLAFLGIRFLCPADLRLSAASITLLAVTSVSSYLSMAFAVPGAFAYLSVRYYAYQTDFVESPDILRWEAPASGKKIRAVVCAVLCAAVLASAGLQAVMAGGLPKDGAAVWQPPEVAAHRGSSVDAPENSIPAFRQAISDRADWIELDVHQTRDGVVVVTHDESLKRIAGVSKNVWELTYDELSQYDVGSWFSPEYADLRVATLDEVLKLCKGKIKLNIELKPTGHEPDFELHVLELIHKNGYEEGEYILASLNADTLKTIKHLEPDAKTLYIMTIAVGNVKDIPFADAFSVEESSITEKLVTSVHATGKKLHAWTVNRSDNVEKMMQLEVDCIISDDPVMAKAALVAAPLSDDLQSVAALFFPEDNLPESPEGESPAI